MSNKVEGRNDVREDVRRKPRKGKNHTYTDRKERKTDRLDEAFDYQKKKKKDDD